MVTSDVATASINFLGFFCGTLLYAVLLTMVLRHPINNGDKNKTGSHRKSTVNWFLIVTASLGLLWNIGNLIEIGCRDYLNQLPSPLIAAIAFTALGFLPALIVHSEWAIDENNFDSDTKFLTIAAYLLSGAAGILHFRAVAHFNYSPETAAFKVLTAGYLLILIALFFTKRHKRYLKRKTVMMAALAFFTVSALHLSRPHTQNSWLIAELIGHHASQPLAFVILYQDYRFAFADLFLKRALSLLFFIGFILSSYLFFIGPLLAVHESHPQPDVQRVIVLLAFGMINAFAYPKFNQFAAWIVDRILLRRVPYKQLQAEIMKNISTLETIETVLSAVREKLTVALTAKTAEIEEIVHNPETDAIRTPLIQIKLNEAKILIPTVNEPHYELTLRDFAGGRRLLSDEINMLESIALQAARRIDALRVIHDRCERELREEEFSKLAAQAELRVLRAQINPHFLFNALTTIGYLINTAPDRAVQTLVQLTGLLRGSLRSSGEFQTLGEELKLIRAYLEIEKARFEERLNVEINIKDEFSSFRVPSLILQPIVENAVKHGISPLKNGGTVSIRAWSEKQAFILQVSDTGRGVSNDELLSKRESRVGLNNVEQRLQLHFNGTAKLKIKSREGDGTVVRIEFGLSDPQPGKQLQVLSPGNARQTEPIFL